MAVLKVWDGAAWVDAVGGSGVDATALAETIRDTIGAALTAGTALVVTVNDAADTITVAAANPLILPLANLGGFQYDTTALFFGRNGATYVGNNVTHNGSDFYVLANTSRAIWMEELGDTGGIDSWRILRSPPGTNPGTFASMLGTDANGKLTGRGFYDSGEVAVLNGNTATVSHGLAARPRVVTIFGLNASGTANSKTAVLAPASATATQLSYLNNTGGTAYVNFYAML